jgi:hypothetical protein
MQLQIMGYILTANTKTLNQIQVMFHRLENDFKHLLTDEEWATVVDVFVQITVKNKWPPDNHLMYDAIESKHPKLLNKML